MLIKYHNYICWTYIVLYLSFDNKDIKYNKSAYLSSFSQLPFNVWLLNESKRTLSVNIFKSTFPDWDTVLRDWLLYSQTTGKVFCVPCCIYQLMTVKTNFHTVFNYWKHSNELLRQHKQSQDHRINVLTYITWKKKKGWCKLKVLKVWSFKIQIRLLSCIREWGH